MKREINFGVIDYYSTGKKTYKVIVEVELENNRNGLPCFSVSGSIGSVAGGQILDDLLEYLSDNELFMAIHRLWKLYHLNDLNAGTIKQTNAIKEWEKSGNKYDYSRVCEYLKSINLYEDNGYRYGSAWLYREIPTEDLQLIKDIIKNNTL